MKLQNSHADTKAAVVDYFASILKVNADQMRTDVHVLELGMDSIMLVEAQRWLKARYGCVIEVQQFFEDLNTIDRIVAFACASPPSASASFTDALEGLPQDAPVAREGVLSKSLTSTGDQSGYGLMRNQLALVGQVIEAQNRLLTATH